MVQIESDFPLLLEEKHLFLPHGKLVSFELTRSFPHIPETMQRAIAKQAEAERERRAKIIHVEGEFQAAAKLD